MINYYYYQNQAKQINKTKLAAFDKCRRSHKRHLYINMNFYSLHKKHNLTSVSLIIGIQDQIFYKPRYVALMFNTVVFDVGKTYPKAINSIKFGAKLKIDFGGKNKDYRS